MTLEEAKKIYEGMTPQSKKLFQQALEVAPGGVAANIKYFEPYPIYMEKGKGAWLEDVDGNKYVDYLASYGPLILGHGHKAVIEATQG